jgi:hypothetical protein
MDGLSKRTRSIRDAIANRTFEAGQLHKSLVGDRADLPVK